MFSVKTFFSVFAELFAENNGFNFNEKVYNRWSWSIGYYKQFDHIPESVNRAAGWLSFGASPVEHAVITSRSWGIWCIKTRYSGFIKLLFDGILLVLKVVKEITTQIVTALLQKINSSLQLRKQTAGCFV